MLHCQECQIPSGFHCVAFTVSTSRLHIIHEARDLENYEMKDDFGGVSSNLSRKLKLHTSILYISQD